MNFEKCFKFQKTANPHILRILVYGLEQPLVDSDSLVRARRDHVLVLGKWMGIQVAYQP